MAGPKVLGRIEDPVVAAAPAGVRIRTRIHPSAEEAVALTAVGAFLGSVYRGELAERIRLGRFDRHTHAVWWAERKHAVTALSSSRWAGRSPARWRTSAGDGRFSRPGGRAARRG